VKKSNSNLRNLIELNVDYSKNILFFLQRITKIMSSSKGRDKICGIVQYLAKMIALTAIHSNIQEVQSAFQKKQMKFHLTAYRTYKSLSQARKIF